MQKIFVGVEKSNVGNRLKRVFPKFEPDRSHPRGVNGRLKFRFFFRRGRIFFSFRHGTARGGAGRKRRKKRITTRLRVFFFTTLGLVDVSELEQTLATGLDEE